MALNKEVWVSQVLEGFYPDDSFLKKVVDYSQFVDNDKLHVASAGIDPKVLINNTTYPINVVGRDDDDNVITLDKFETENTLVRRPEALEYSYDKLESVIRQHRATLTKSVSMKAAHAFAPDGDTTDTPLVVTTGETANGRKRLQLVDILTLKERFDDAEIPLEDRYTSCIRNMLPTCCWRIPNYLRKLPTSGRGNRSNSPDSASIRSLRCLYTVWPKETIRKCRFPQPKRKPTPLPA